MRVLDVSFSLSYDPPTKLLFRSYEFLFDCTLTVMGLVPALPRTLYPAAPLASITSKKRIFNQFLMCYSIHFLNLFNDPFSTAFPV
jgi:hypothetical protein